MILLRLSLLTVGLSGIIALPTLFLTWASNVEMYAAIGKVHGLPQSIESPLLEYYLYMFFAFNCVIGFYFIWTGIFPRKNKSLINLLGISLIFIGIVIGIHGFRLGLPAYPFYGDLITCAIFGPLLLGLNAKYNKAPSNMGR